MRKTFADYKRAVYKNMYREWLDDGMPEAYRPNPDSWIIAIFAMIDYILRR